MNRLIEILDVGDGGYMSRSKHLAYVSIPEEYILVPQNKYERLMLTSDGSELVSERLRGIYRLSIRLYENSSDGNYKDKKEHRESQQ